MSPWSEKGATHQFQAQLPMGVTYRLARSVWMAIYTASRSNPNSRLEPRGD